MSNKIFIENKIWYKSKTLQINTLLFIAAIAGFIAGEVETGTVLTVASVLNFIVRWYTTSGISF